MKNKLLLILPMLLLTLFFVNAIDYNFPINSNIKNYALNNNNTYMNTTSILGNNNNVELLVGFSDNKVKRFNLSNNVDLGNFSIFGVCNRTDANLTFISKYSNGLYSAICKINQAGSKNLIYAVGNSTSDIVSLTDTNGAIEERQVFALSNGNMVYMYVLNEVNEDLYIFMFNGSDIGGSFGFGLVDTLQCNNFRSTYLGGYDLFLQDGFDKAIFTNGVDYQYLEFFSNCTNSNLSLVDSFVYSELNNEQSNVIINDLLYTSYANVNSSLVSLYSSADVNIYTGLVEDNGLWFTNNSACFDNNYFFRPPSSNSDVFQCVNALDDSNGIYCANITDINICSGGCSYDTKNNVYGVQYYEGVCLQDDCVNDCNVLGYQTSPTINSVQTCGFFDTDGCLDSQIIYCSETEYSYEGECITLNYTQNPISKIEFNIRPYTSINVKGGVFGCPEVVCIFDNGVWNCPEDTCSNAEAVNPNLKSVTFDSVNNILDVKTRTDNGGSGLFTLDLNVQGGNASHVVGVDCDYKSIIENTIITYNNVTSGFNVQTLNETTTYTSITNPLGFKNKNIITFITNSESVEMLVNSSDSKILQSLWININMTTKEIVVKNSNSTGNLLFTDVFTSSSLRKIELQTYFDSVNGEQNSLIRLYDNNNALISNKGVVMQSFNDLTGIAPFNIIITPILNTNVYSISREMFNSNPETYSLLQVEGVKDFINEYEDVKCSYLQDGTFTARVYLSEEFLGQFFSYKDLIINKQVSNGGLTPSQQQGSITEDLTAQQKILISFGISFVVLMILIITGLLQQDSEKRLLIFAGLFLFFGGLITFSVIGWLPVWILLVSGVLAIGGIGLFFLKSNNGG